MTTQATLFKILWSLERSVSAMPDKTESQYSRQLDTRAFASNFVLSRSRSLMSLQCTCVQAIYKTERNVVALYVKKEQINLFLSLNS